MTWSRTDRRSRRPSGRRRGPFVRGGRRWSGPGCALALGGTGGTSIAAAAFRELPLGVPKVIVSTATSGDTAAYVRETDLVLMPSVVEVAGVRSPTSSACSPRRTSSPAPTRSR
ncbi:Tm-1-like ATP-binding domain-containing protein [Kribbella sp. NPDC048928]|uniref:Tm-1-like ATP-binding domain-containing protein n=1 Tax=Kribbella sp. NPDC048928 TaxID=3364111 RepID=UPI0037129AC2